MAAVSSLAFLSLLIFLFCIHARIVAASSDYGYKTYIVYVSESVKPPVNTSHHDWYSSILQSLSPLSTDLDTYYSYSLVCPAEPLSTVLPYQSPSNVYYDLPKTKLLYSYEHAIHGFAARLSASQAEELRHQPGILSVIPDSISQLQTTRSLQFLGLADSWGIWPNTNYGEDIIIGILDSGIRPDHPSFSDAGLSPVPSSWRGGCETALDFPSGSCNRKLIGARAYYGGYEENMRRSLEEMGESKSPTDYDGHGTHTASTAAGSVVSSAGFYAYATGEAKGVAIKARIAAYKVCWRGGCFDSDILAALNQAISDGVHVLSLSLGRSPAMPYDEDPIAIAAFHAAERGILTSASAGNSGPSYRTAVNIAPWILSVGASTIDREFPTDVVLGDGSILQGVSLYYGKPLLNALLPLVYASGAGSRFCHQGELVPSMVTGKIVVCDVGGDTGGVAKGYAVHLAGGVGMILANTEEQVEGLKSEAHLIPATMVGVTNGNIIKNYVRSQLAPTAIIIFRGTVVWITPSAPRVGVFSSRGPNVITQEILKPDVIAPGVNILAAWSKFANPSGFDGNIDQRRVDFNIISGTSMACPHVSGIAALLRKARPYWSPAAIKSAIMTTAYNVDNNGRNIVDLATGVASTPFAHGSGHVDPNKALNPGLVYDMGTSDYVQFLCSIGYTQSRIAVFVSNPESCRPGMTPGDVNYPSFSVVFSRQRTVVTHTRRVRKVESTAAAVYNVTGIAPEFVEVKVTPDKLTFDQYSDTLTYQVTFTSAAIETIGDTTSTFGYLEWIDGQQHIVRSPIAVLWNRDSWVDAM
ncbi:subtilisin-like protease SBT1.4 isoform X1 [Coffea arabica]|uniref:Subtilisin-like protease SBT1.4 isoform X1 n=1 Tax=Coffea arabica TaxID=13443 RepID=A0ABM4WYS3_COFAR